MSLSWLRPIGILVLQTSLILGISAMVKAQYLAGVTQSNQNLLVGLFTACTQPVVRYRTGNGELYCSSVEGLLPTGVSQWEATAIMLVIGTIFKGFAMNGLIGHWILTLKNTSKRAWNITMIVIVCSTIVFELIGLIIGAATMNQLQTNVYSRGSWEMGKSMQWTIAAFVLNILGCVTYGLGWKFQGKNHSAKFIEPFGVPVSSDETTLTTATTPSVPEIVFAPQQATLNINGQTVSATLIPSSGNQIPTAQPVASAPAPADVVYMPAQSCGPPQPYAPSQHYVQHATHYPAVTEMSNTTYV